MSAPRLDTTGPGGGVTVGIEPPTPAPGEPFRLRLDAPVGWLEPSVRIGAIRLGLEPRGGGRWEALAGIDLEQAPGPLEIDVRATAPNGEPWRRRLTLEVSPKDYPVERLTVDDQFVEPPPEVTQRIEEEAALLASLWRREPGERLFDGRVREPIPGVAGRNFGRRRVFNGQARSPHSGTDLKAQTGTPVVAAARGRVALAREFYFSGNLIVLDHGGGVFTLYAHLSVIAVSEGEVVEPGQNLGQVGASGRVTGPHLHWGARAGAARVEPFALQRLMREDHAGGR